MSDLDGYEPDDPKSPGYRERLFERADYLRSIPAPISETEPAAGNPFIEGKPLSPLGAMLFELASIEGEVLLAQMRERGEIPDED